MRSVFVALALAAAHAAAHNPLPSIQILTNGLDMIAGVQNSSDPSISYLYPIFDVTYATGQTYTIPGNTVTWLVPDQVQVIDQPSKTVNSNEGLYETVNEFVSQELSSFSFNAGISVSCGNDSKCMSLDFKYSKEAYTYREQLSATQRASGFSTMSWTFYEMSMTAPPFAMQLNSGFQYLINKLPATISSAADQQLYNAMVQYYGTHFSMNAVMGAYAHVSSFLDQSFMASKSISWTETQFNLEFHLLAFDLGIGGFSNKSQINVDASFAAATQTYMFYKGGDPTLATNTTQKQWLASTLIEPAWLTVTLLDLSDAFPFGMTAQANNMDATVRYYLTNGALPPSPVGLEYYTNAHPKPVEYWTTRFPAYFAAKNQQQ